MIVQKESDPYTETPAIKMSKVKFSQLKVMIMDDEPFIRNLTKRIVNSIGITNIIEAGSGTEALHLLDKKNDLPQIILCDLDMPGMDGIEFLRHLAMRELTLGVILISHAHKRIIKTVEDLAVSHNLYFLGSIEKPIKSVQLQSLLASFDDERTARAASDSIKTLTEEELLHGLHNDLLTVVFQPKVNIKTNKVTSVEALARWNHPEHGQLGPINFIPLAEEKGHMDELTDIVYTKSMAYGGEWLAAGLNLGISVNFSVDSFNRLDLPEYIVSKAKTEGMDPHYVTLEVTESRVMGDLKMPLEILTRLRLKGIGLSIDDFGTGYSSLEQIKRIPFTELKIDRAFVTGAAEDPFAQAIMESSIALGKKLDLCIVAEGVENQADWDLVKQLGCDIAQGYFISKPLAGEAIPNFIIQWENS